MEQGDRALDQVYSPTVGEDQLQFVAHDRLARRGGDLGGHLIGLEFHAIAKDLVGNSRFAGRSAGRDVSAMGGLQEPVRRGVAGDPPAFRVMSDPHRNGRRLLHRPQFRPTLSLALLALAQRLLGLLALGDVQQQAEDPLHRAVGAAREDDLAPGEVAQGAIGVAQAILVVADDDRRASVCHSSISRARWGISSGGMNARKASSPVTVVCTSGG